MAAEFWKTFDLLNKLLKGMLHSWTCYDPVLSIMTFHLKHVKFELFIGPNLCIAFKSMLCSRQFHVQVLSFLGPGFMTLSSLKST